jgi:Flp pilus assembly CpaF family ATPase
MTIDKPNLPPELENSKGKVVSQENIVSGSQVFNELIFQCYTCHEDPDGDIRRSPVCMDHCFQKLNKFSAKQQKLKVIFNTKQSQITYSLQESKKLVYLAQVLNRVLQKLKKILNDYEITNGFSEQIHQWCEILYTDPCGVLFQLQLFLQDSSTRGSRKRTRKSARIIKNLKAVEKTLRSSEILNQTQLMDIRVKRDQTRTIYRLLLQPLILDTPPKLKIDTSSLQKIDSYENPPYVIDIYKDTKEGFRWYIPSALTNKPPYDVIFRTIIDQVNSYLFDALPSAVLKLDHVLNIIQERAKFLLTIQFPNISSAFRNSLALIIAAELTGLSPIFPYLIDDQVHEFYLDGPGTNLYLDHEKFGRCLTPTAPSLTSLNRIRTRLRIESGQRLDTGSPSLKTEIITRLFHVRASIDIPPLAYSGPYLDFRRLKLHQFNLVDLVQRGTISSKAAAFLYYALQRRCNIIIVGAPGSGKTTLANALNSLAPKHWRKIFLEDSIESLPEVPEGYHQLRLQVPPFGGGNSNLTKSQEIIKLLHRSPDYLFLGEIQTAEHSRSMFHALSSGLTGIQTCHANSPSDLLLRWIYHHDVPSSCLGATGVIVFLLREPSLTNSKRMVLQISEINPTKLDLFLNMKEASVTTLLDDIFSWDSQKQAMTQTCDFNNLSTLSLSKSTQVFGQSDHNEAIDSIETQFKQLTTKSKPSLKTIRRTLNKIPPSVFQTG